MTDLLAPVCDRIAASFAGLDCSISLCAIDLASGAQIALDADRPVISASVFKAQVALEFYAQVEAGELDPREMVEIDPAHASAGPTGVSGFADPTRISLRDLCRLMMTVSDNAAADILTRRVGIARANARAAGCGCADTVIVSDFQTMLDEVARELSFESYRVLQAAQSGALGAEAQARSADQVRIDALAALDPTRATRTTARDMSNFMRAVWRDEAASEHACAALRAVMGEQLTTRLRHAVPDGWKLASKTGTLFGRVRNEAAALAAPDGRVIIVSIFTRAAQPFAGATAIEAALVGAVGQVLATLLQARFQAQR